VGAPCGSILRAEAPSVVEQAWWETKADATARLAKLIPLEPLKNQVNSDADIAIRLTIGGELGFVYAFELVVRYDKKRMTALRSRAYFCDIFAINDSDSKNARNEQLGILASPASATDALGQMVIEDFVTKCEQFFTSNAAKQGPLLTNDTTIVMEMQKNGVYSRIGGIADDEKIFEANIGEIRVRFTTIVKAMLGKFGEDN
jgi:hypothetical protein